MTGPQRSRLIVAVFLLLEAGASFFFGAWLLAGAWFGEPVTPGRTGDVIGPPDAWIDAAARWTRTGAGLWAAGLGLSGLVAGVSWLRRTPSRRVAPTLMAFALPWCLISGWSLLRASGSEHSMNAWLAGFVAALSIGLLHVPMARACRVRPADQAAVA